MALVKENIEEMKSNLSIIRTLLSNDVDEIDQSVKALNQNKNYQIFIQGTDIGKELNDKLNQLIEVHKRIINNEAANLLKNCENFISIQEQLNNTK